MPREVITVREVNRLIKEKQIRFVDYKFIDLFGFLHHVTQPIEAFEEEVFIKGVGFDGSSVRGFQAIHDSDMIIKPDMTSMFIDPFMEDPTLSFFCNVLMPGDRSIYTRDPRSIAQRAERFLQISGLADVAYYGPELEFFLFDDIRFGQTTNEGYYHIDNKAAFWNTGRQEGGENLGYKPARKRAYFAAPPIDVYHNLRSKMVTILQQIGVRVELHHHEVASGGQNEIGIRFGTLTEMGDNALKYKYVVKNVARRYGKTATFMPKPLFEENGTGMHVNMSLWKGGRNLFFQEGTYADLSKEAVYFIGGLLTHAPALCGLCNPSTNSYRRLVPGYEAPLNLVYSRSNRSAAVRIPMNAAGPKAKRVEYRPPDPSANPYLAFAALLMAGIDGIQRKLEPPDPIDEDIYEMGERLTQMGIGNTPGSLAQALDELEKNHDFLMQGNVFTEDFIETWISLKRKQEVDYVRLRPHPGEFALYFDI